MNMPWTLIGTAVGIAGFPTMAELAARCAINEQRAALSGSLRAILTLVLPAAAGLVILGRPIIRFLYEGGEFTMQSTELVYFALQYYAVMLISQSVLEVVVRAFAAQQDTLTPLLVSFFTTALNLALAIWLADSNRLAHGGLALANGIAVGVEALVGLVILHYRWHGVNAKQILVDTFRAGLATLVMAGAVTVFLEVFKPNVIFALGGGGVLGIVIYFVFALALGIKEVRTLPLTIIKRATGLYDIQV